MDVVKANVSNVMEWLIIVIWQIAKLRAVHRDTVLLITLLGHDEPRYIG